MQTTSEEDAANSFNQRSKYSDLKNNNRPADYVTYDISSYSRTELMQLKKRLTVELEQIQGLYEQIESGSSLLHQYRDYDDDDDDDQPPQVTNGKMKKQKRPIPYNSLQDPKRLCQRSWNGFDLNHIGDLMKKSRQILTTLMKNKHSWVFREPVDALSLGLHDYHQIVKHPMDLGTVKAKFSNNAYATPMDFADDVRLTFNNAVLYNPKTDKVHAWAGELLARFEDLFRPIEEKMGGALPREDHHPPPVYSSVNDDLQRNSWNHIPTPEIERRKKSTPPSLILPTISKKQQEKTQMPKNMMKPSAASSHSLVQSPPPPLTTNVNGELLSKSNNPGKLPKPKAKDVGKREMSIEEKDRLSIGLQNLPQEKMPQLIHIIRKRNCSQLGQVEDEIELDIETLDTETLWELDRFVTNWKKMVSKNKRQAVMSNNVSMAGGTTTTREDENMVREINGCTQVVLKEAGEKEGSEDDDDVDIGGEEMAMMSSFPAVEIEKDGGGACREEEQGGGSSSGGSSSSGSDSSSSSSSSDSDSSGGNNSDADEAQSRGGMVK
ncbi:transcription factor GTE7-like [Impatiens glandulifera]|uniref:transcription factor GTE7-like n=1 Tax=Impatiens glandulifera TaxID=253017 RepID=UPI001FB14191|nr:transcription factor GTE7-like [Impatiens glandulifera]